MRGVLRWIRRWLTWSCWVQPDPAEAVPLPRADLSRVPEAYRTWPYDPELYAVWRQQAGGPAVLIGHVDEVEAAELLAEDFGPGVYDVRTQGGEVVRQLRARLPASWLQTTAAERN
jgi:hypothetical protein